MSVPPAPKGMPLTGKHLQYCLVCGTQASCKKGATKERSNDVCREASAKTGRAGAATNPGLCGPCGVHVA